MDLCAILPAEKGGIRMEVRILKYFLAVAQEQSITKAAELLHTTQPNLSRQLNELENSIGKKLFDRGAAKSH